MLGVSVLNVQDYSVCDKHLGAASDMLMLRTKCECPYELHHLASCP